MTKAITPITLMAIGVAWLMFNDVIAGERPTWIYFSDKGIDSYSQLLTALDQAESNLTDRAKIRRSKLGKSRLIDELDLPVNLEYLYRLEEITGLKIRHVSRWLNAVSVSASPEILSQIIALHFVRKIAPVASKPRNQVRPIVDPPLNDEPLPFRDFNFDYGGSLRQNTFMNLPELHDRGYLGEGVLIGICDAGFDNLNHNCFQDLRINAAWDFVNNDDNVANEGDHGSGQHGTRTLSILAGFDEGHLIGVAPEATYVLAKTENTEGEAPIEEDNWVAAIEWMDSLGVDIVSSSLGYMEWYRYDDLNGETAVTTIAANRAVEVGIVVVNSMGNSGFNNYPADKLITPADGFDVFAIGATNRDSALAGFSSIGPTFDGRIKPDFVTFGSSVIVASSVDDAGYAAGAGTSFSAPAVAGLCALLIEAAPYLTPVTLKTLLQNSSDNRDEPDTLRGWGIPDALLALHQIQSPHFELVIPLHVGWNTVSHNLTNLQVKPFPEYLTPLLEANILAFAKDGHGRFFAPRVPFNNIPNWNPQEGYQLSLEQADTLRFAGDLTAYTQPITLREGWQIIAYLPNFEMSVQEALTSLTQDDALTIVKDEWGRFFLPGRDYSNMLALVPGRGYHVRLARDAVLRYPRFRLNEVIQRDLQLPEHFPQPIPTDQGMSILLVASDGIESSDEAAFVDSRGKVLGSGVFVDGLCGIALWSGEEGAKLPDLKIWKHSTGQNVNPDLLLLEGDRHYVVDGVTVLLASVELTAASALDITTFPTPFNDRLTISINNLLGDADFHLYDLGGKLVAKGSLSSGQQSATLNASGFGAGLYILKVSYASTETSVKIICLK